MKYTSIIFTHWGMNDFRSKLMRESVTSLITTTQHLPVEVIAVDNGSSIEDSKFLLELTQKGDIQCYIRNSNNLGFGFSRNQGLGVAKGEFLGIVDNDLIYQKGWLEKCLEVLDLYPTKKIYATPIQYPRAVNGYEHSRYESGNLKDFKLNMRAGSNCFVMRRKDYKILGDFANHRIAGTVWTDHAVRCGYLAAVAPGELVVDKGLRLGYNLQEAVPIKRTLLNGEEVYFNQDEYKIPDK